MNLFDLYAKITLDTGDYEGAVDRSSALGDRLADAFDNIVRVSGSVERNVDKIASSYKSAEKEMKGAGDAAEDAAKGTKKAADGAEQLAEDMEDAGKEASDLEGQLEKTGKTSDSIGGKFAGLGSKIKTGLGVAAKVGAAAITGIGAAATGVVTGLLALESATEEYRVAQGKLNTAFEAAGYGTDTAKEAYKGFYAILGDTDTATEASQLLSHLIQDEQDVTKWTRIASGVYGSFGDSLPIEGLIEAANETSKVGVVTGQLSDALNWVGISEDEFNAKLAACGSEAERNKLIMEALDGAYSDAADAFEKNNAELIAAREAQAMMDESLSKLGTTVSRVKNKVKSEFTPAIAQAVDGFNDLLNGTEGGEEKISAAFATMVQKGVEMLPQFAQLGVSVLSSLGRGIIDNAGLLAQTAGDLLTGLVSGVAEALPSLVDGAVQIVDSLALYLVDGAAPLAESAVSLIDSLCLGLIDAATGIITAGTSIVDSLGQGIAGALPNLATSAGDILAKLIEFIIVQVPKIEETGRDLLRNLTLGLVNAIPNLLEAIPGLIESFLTSMTQRFNDIKERGGGAMMLEFIGGILAKIPEIISTAKEVFGACVNTIIENFPEMVAAGLDMIASLIEGIVDALPDVVEQAGTVASDVLDAIKEGLAGIFNIGADLIDGLWEGISSKSAWVKEKVGGFVSGIKNKFTGKDGFDIHSPSKWAQGVFRYVLDGAGLGLDEGAPALLRNASGVVSKIKDGFDMDAATVDFKASGSGRLAEMLDSLMGGANEILEITVQSVLDGEIIEENVTRRQRQKLRATGEA